MIVGHQSATNPWSNDHSSCAPPCPRSTPGHRPHPSSGCSRAPALSCAIFLRILVQFCACTRTSSSSSLSCAFARPHSHCAFTLGLHLAPCTRWPPRLSCPPSQSTTLPRWLVSLLRRHLWPPTHKFKPCRHLRHGPRRPLSPLSCPRPLAHLVRLFPPSLSHHRHTIRPHPCHKK